MTVAARPDGMPEHWERYTPEEKELARAYANARNAPLPLSLHEFVDLVKPDYIWERYAEEIAGALQLVADGVYKRLMIYAPPQLGKSELVSRIFPAYLLYRFPRRIYGLTSYGANLAYGFSRSARMNYRIAASSSSTGGETEGVEEWQTGKGGALWAGGVGGAATGKPAYGVIIDDPVKDPTEAASATTQERNIEWFDQVIMPRTIPHDGFIVLVQTRWHMKDLAGKLLEREKGDSPEHWVILNLMALKEADNPKLFPRSCRVIPDWRRPGESVSLKRYPLEKLLKIRTKNSYVWNALYQQRPTPKEGGTFKRGWFEIVPAPPLPEQILVIGRWWDLGATDDAGSYTAGVKMARTRRGLYYIWPVVRGQWGAGKRDARIRQTAQADGVSVKQYSAQDPGQAGKTAAAAFRALLDGFPVQTIIESGDKETRADPFASAAYADDSSSGRVKLIRGDGEWLEPFLEELGSFPFSLDDDQVDATANIYNVLSRWRPPAIQGMPTTGVWTG